MASGNDPLGEFGGAPTNGNTAGNNNGFGNDPLGEYGAAPTNGNSAAPAPEAAAPASRPTNMGLGEGLLGKGMAGPEVKALQEALRAQGADIKADGILAQHRESLSRSFSPSKSSMASPSRWTAWLDLRLASLWREPLTLMNLLGSVRRVVKRTIRRVIRRPIMPTLTPTSSPVWEGDGKAKSKDSITAPNNDARATQAPSSESKGSETAVA